MTYNGHFIDLDDNRVEVTIETPNGFSRVDIGSNGLYFSDEEPVLIEEDSADSFEAVIRKTAKINLVTKNYKGDTLFAAGARETRVTITRNQEVLFYGYVVPQTYNQPFAYLHDEFTLDCVDCLSTLEAFRYNDAVAANYDDCIAHSDKVSFQEIIRKALEPFDCAVMYDGSKRTKTKNYNVFEELGISESIIYGDEPDDVWTYEECLENILTYLGLHIRQEGKVFYIFDWDSIRNQNNSWIPIIGSALPRRGDEYVITKDMYRSDITNVSVGEVYNQIKLKIDTKDEETLFVMPFDDDFTNSLYSKKQRYCSEYWVEDNRGIDGRRTIGEMLNGHTKMSLDGVKCHEDRWYMRALYNSAWTFNLPSSVIYSGYGGAVGCQDDVPNYLKTHNFVATMLQLGKVTHEPPNINSADLETPEMNNYLYISVNGDEKTNPSDSALRNLESNPIATYVGNSSGATLSPTDSATTNYIVINCQLMLQPQIREFLNAYSRQASIWSSLAMGSYAPMGDDADYHGDNLFVPMWWTAITPKSTPTRKVYNNIVGTGPVWHGLEMPREDDDWHGPIINYKNHEHPLVFRGDRDNFDKDMFNKVPVLECELIIGDKRLIEIDKFGGMNTDKIDKGNNFKWVKVGEEPNETYGGVTNKNTTFTIGFNPEFEDYIYNVMYDCCDTVPHDKIDAKGMAIPVTKDDNISGKVQFRIIGPVNTGYNLTLYRHATFWRHSSWDTENIPILKYCQNIIIKDLTIKKYSDSNQNELMQEKDLVYMSAEDDSFENKKEVDFKIFTNLSSDEYAKKGMLNKVYMNTVIDMTNGNPSGEIYNAITNEIALAEEHYIDQYYRDYSVPRITLETELHDMNLQFDSLYDSIPLKKSFYVQSINRNLRNGTAVVRLREKGDFYLNLSDPVFAQKMATAYGDENGITPKQAKTVSTTTSTMFSGDTNVTNAQYGSFGITAVEDNAFNGAVNLQNIDMPNTVTSIGNSAFKDTTSLSAVNIPKSVTEIGQSAFEGSGVTSVTIPSSVTEIKDSTFANSKLESVNFGSNVSSIGNSAFKGSDITEIVLSNSVTSLGEGVFQNCQNLTKVIL